MISLRSVKTNVREKLFFCGLGDCLYFHTAEASWKQEMHTHNLEGVQFQFSVMAVGGYPPNSSCPNVQKESDGIHVAELTG